MSVWPESASAVPRLCGAEGELVSVRISIEPRLVERLLDTLARLEFPINPQLYHNAATAHTVVGGLDVLHPVTIVEFPAWAGRLAGVRDALVRAGFDLSALAVRSMLDQIHDGGHQALASA